MIDIEIIPPLRKADKWGSGHYGAPRGSRTHNGVDYEAPAGSTLLSPVTGVVTKLGYPYSDDLSYHYVQIQTADGYKHRFFYILPGVEIGEQVFTGDALGTVQDLTTRYEGITPHFHYGVKTPDSTHINPSEYWDDQ